MKQQRGFYDQAAREQQVSAARHVPGREGHCQDNISWTRAQMAARMSWQHRQLPQGHQHQNQAGHQHPEIHGGSDHTNPAPVWTEDLLAVKQAKEMDVMQKSLQCKIKEEFPQEAEQKKLASCVSMLREVVEAGAPGWFVKPFGSAANGYATIGSDLDVTVYRPNPALAVDQVKFQDAIVEQLAKFPQFRIVEHIKTARIPILRLKFDEELKFDQSLDVDLSFENTDPFSNTNLLLAYAKLSPHVRDLVVAVKLWAKTVGVSGARYGNLSAYSLALMVIYYMQVDPEVELTCLKTEAFEGPEPPEVTDAVPEKLQNTKVSELQLLTRFFYFYANIFNWGTEVISIRNGERLENMSEKFDKLRSRDVNRLHIEDPFEHERNLHCVLGDTNEEFLFRKIKEAADCLENYELPLGLMPKTQVPAEPAPMPAMQVAHGPGTRSPFQPKSEWVPAQGRQRPGTSEFKPLFFPDARDYTLVNQHQSANTRGSPMPLSVPPVYQAAPLPRKSGGQLNANAQEFRPGAMPVVDFGFDNTLAAPMPESTVPVQKEAQRQWQQIGQPSYQNRQPTPGHPEQKANPRSYAVENSALDHLSAHDTPSSCQSTATTQYARSGSNSITSSEDDLDHPSYLEQNQERLRAAQWNYHMNMVQTRGFEHMPCTGPDEKDVPLTTTLFKTVVPKAPNMQQAWSISL